jgi:hypothetical protein
MAPAAADMHRLEARVASFTAVTRPKRAAKIAFPLSADSHPDLTPASLASAGFYHTPVAGEEDACTCFLCPLALSGWDEGDNPHVEHVGRDTPCAWRELVCALEVDRINGGPGRLRTEFATADELPSSEARTALRVQTFGTWWPHTTPSAHDVSWHWKELTPARARRVHLHAVQGVAGRNDVPVVQVRGRRVGGGRRPSVRYLLLRGLC